MKVQNNVNATKTFKNVELQEIFLLGDKKYMKTAKLATADSVGVNSYCLTNDQYHFVRDDMKVTMEPTKLREVQFKKVETGETFVSDDVIYIKLPPAEDYKGGCNAYDVDANVYEFFPDTQLVSLTKGTLTIDKM